MDYSSFQFPFGSRKLWVVGGLLFLILSTSFVAQRTYTSYSTPSTEFDWTLRGMSDFHNLYNYSLAFRNGVNPYTPDVMSDYLVTRPAAPFSPLQFFIHAPFTYVGLPAADLLFSVFHFFVIGLLAYCCITMSRLKFDWALWLWIFGFLVFSRPGHIGLFTGYMTVQLALGSIVALHFAKSKPWLAAIGFLFASGKPTYFIPLAILMACRLDRKALLQGGILTAAVAIAGIGYLATFSSVDQVVAGIQAGQDAFHDDPTEDPVNTWTRIDLLGMIAKSIDWKPNNTIYLASMFVLLILPGVAVYKARTFEFENGASGLSAVISVLALLVTLYHHSYDCMLVSVACVGLALNGSRVCPEIPKRSRIMMVGLLTVPAVNYISTQSFRDVLSLDQHSVLWQSITMINGACLLLALLIAMLTALLYRVGPARDSE